MTVVKTIEDSEGKRRVLLFQRENGTFGFEEQLFSEHEFEHCWVPTGRYSISICDTLETASREATERVNWLTPD